MKNEMKHTREPWAVSPFGSVWVPAQNHDVIAKVGGRCDDMEQAANAARIVSCVNACSGMADPVAEVKALREVVELYLELSPDQPPNLTQLARAALEGGAK